ncbi:GTP-binding protein [Piscinibacter sakaiensis]|uniref:GTP-binding protein n=1 Tax=Piscinibacter sakaiensis TaxID=1547922 RepID=UPI003AAC9F27
MFSPQTRLPHPTAAFPHTPAKGAPINRGRTPGASQISYVCIAEQIRNIAIIAHVDHGKTTWSTRCCARSAPSARTRRCAAATYSNDLEKERGITILSKNCAVEWKGTHINIVDTPGHADFSVWCRAGAVDAARRCWSTPSKARCTRFVTKKAWRRPGSRSTRQQGHAPAPAPTT